MKTRVISGVLILGSVLLGGSVALVAAESGTWHPQRILVMPGPDVDAGALSTFEGSLGVTVHRRYPALGGLQLVAVSESATVASLIVEFEQSGLVQYAEPDYRRGLDLIPNDPLFADGTLWSLHNTGQMGGVMDADIDMSEAWDLLTSASNVVVAVLDTGVRATHEDLEDNIWHNSVEGGYGWNAIAHNGTPEDDDGHGSHVSGVLGAVGNNERGLAGVVWGVQIMAGKCFDAEKNGFDSDFIECLEFARNHGAKIINMSFSEQAYSASFSNAVFHARESGIIIVASAGNDAADVDIDPVYPACFSLDNILAVAATTRRDQLWGSSNYGATNVDLAAPGAEITSTFAFGDEQYIGPLSGTSLAAPHVSGACALLWARYPTETHQQIIARLLAAVDPLPSLSGKCLTGGRLNVHRALSPPIQLSLLSTGGELPVRFRVSAGPSRVCVVEVSSNLDAWVSVLTNTTSPAGSFDFTDLASTHTTDRFFRVVSAP